MKAIVLAAGYATRLYPLTKDKPKALLKLNEKTILDYLLDQLSAIASLDKLYVVTNDRFYSQFVEWDDDIKGRYHFAVEVVNDGTADNETRLGAVRDLEFVVRTFGIDEDVIVAPADNIYQFNIQEFLNFFQEKRFDSIIAHKIDDMEFLKRAGVVELGKDNRVIRLEEKPAKPRSHFACPALYLFKKETLPLIGTYLAQGNNPDAPGHFIAWLYRQVPVYAYEMREPYFDIGTLEAYRSVCSLLGRERSDVNAE